MFDWRILQELLHLPTDQAIQLALFLWSGCTIWVPLLAIDLIWMPLMGLD
jgi:hypothetical protein